MSHYRQKANLDWFYQGKKVCCLVVTNCWVQWKVQIQKIKLGYYSHRQNSICLVTEIAGNQYLIRLRPGKLAPREPLTHTSVQVSMQFWNFYFFLPQIKVSTTLSGSPSPWGWYSVSGKRREESYHASAAWTDWQTESASVMINGLTVVLLHHVKIILYVVPLCLLFFSPNPK